MRLLSISFLLLVLSFSAAYGQATFETSKKGNWFASNRWNLISGTDADGIPDANDNVIVRHDMNFGSAGGVTNLTFDGGEVAFTSNVTLAIGGNVTVISNSSIAGYSNNHVFQVAGNFTVNSGVSIDVGALNLTVNGTTTVNGDLNISGYGAKPRNFDDIIINSGGTMLCEGADAYTFNGDITNNGTFTAVDFGTTFAFAGTSGVISGSGLLSFFDAVFNASSSYTNQGNMQIRNSMSGSGTFINGNGGELELQNGGPFTVGTFNASATGNTITYTGYGDPTGFTGSYYNLVLNKSSGTLGFSGAPSILNDLTIQSGIFQVTAVTVNIGNDLNLEGGEFTPDNASAVVNIGGDLNITGGEYDHNNGDVNVTGNISVTGGAFNYSGSSSTLDGGSMYLEGVTLVLSQGTITTTGDLTVETGTDLTGNGAILNVGGNMAYNDGVAEFTAGTLAVNDLTVAAGETLTFTNNTFSSTGTTTVNGTLELTGSSGTKGFGSITVNSGGVYNVTQPNTFTVSGDITNNGSFTGCPGYGTCTYTLTSASGTIDGTAALSMRDLIINSPASYTNQTDLTITQSLTGTGSFVNANGSTLELQGAGPFSLSNFDASAAVNTVTYSGIGDPSLNAGSYYNLIINKSSGTITVNSTTSVANDLTVTQGILATGASTLTVSNDLLLQGGEFTPNNASSVVNIGGDFNITAGEYDHNFGDVNVTGNISVTGGTFNFTGSSSTLDGGSMYLEGVTLVLSQGTITTTGDLTVETGTNLTGNGATVNVGGNLAYNDGVAEFTAGALSANNVTIAAGETLTFSNVAYTSTGTTTVNGTLNVTGASGTKAFGSILVNSGGNYNVTQPSPFTVSGDITNNGTFTGCPGFGTCTYTLSSTSGLINGSAALSMRDVIINSPGSYTNQTDLTITQSLTGSGTLANANGSTLTLQNTGPFSISNLDASTAANTVTYEGTGDPSMNPGPYYDLVINKSGGTVNVNSGASVTNDLTVTLGILAIGASTLSVTNDVLLQGGELTPNNASAVMNVGGDFNVTGGEYDHNLGDVNVTGNIGITGGSFFLNGGSSTIDAGSISLENLALTFTEGAITTTGDFDLNASSTLNVSGVALDVGGTFSQNAGSSNFNSGSPTLNNLTVSAGILTINASTVNVTNTALLEGGEITPNNASAVMNVGGDFNITGGEYDHNLGAVNVTGAMDVTGGTFFLTDASSTIDAGSFSVQNISMTLSESTITTTGDFEIGTGATFVGSGTTFDIGGSLNHTGGTASFTTGTVSPTDIYVASGQNLIIGGPNLTSTGTTSLDGTITFNSATGTKTVGDILVNSGGTWSVTTAENFTVSGDITNNGTFTADPGAGTSIYTLTSTSGILSGSSGLTIPHVVINSPASYSNQGDFTISNSLTGTGSYANANGSTLTLQNAGPFSVTTFDASAAVNTVTYTGTGDPALNSGSYYDLVINKSSGTISVSAAASVANDLTVSQGIMAMGAATLTVTNDILLEGGEFTPNNASGVVNVGGDFNITGGEYDHNLGDVNVTGAMDVTGGTFFLADASSTIDAGSFSVQNISLTLSEATITTTGDFDIGTGATFVGSGTTFDIGGSLNHTGGTASFTTGTVSPTDIYVASGRNLIIGGPNLTSTGTTSLDGTITFNSATGTKEVGNILVNGTGTWDVTTAEDFTVSGNITNNGTFNNEPGTGTSTYTLTSTSGTLGGSNELVIKDVEISSSGSYTNVNLFTVERALTGSGTFINGAAGTFTYTGDNSSGTNFTITNFDPTTTGNTVVFAGTTNQQWRGTTGTNNDYYNVIVDMASGGSTRLNLSSDVRVNGTLTITEGDPVLGTYDLELGASSTITGGDANDWLRITSTGVVRQYYDAVGDDKVFPIGDTDDYSPITSMVITSATLGSNAYLEFTVTDAAHPNRSTGNEELGGDDEGVEATAYITRYWTVTANDISLPFYTVSYQYIDDDVVGTESDMIGTLYAQPPGESFYDWSDIGTVNATNNTATISDSEYWGVLYAQDDKMDRLPVQLISFNAEATVNSVMLKWKTATEENNSFFSIERSVDGLNFKEIGQKQGFGNSSAIQLYSFVDSYPLNGRTFYRLKQVDFNGQYEYSEVITVVWNGNGIQGRLNVYPNPVQAGQNLSVSIEGNDPATISWLLLDMNGRVVYEGNFTNSGLLQINTSEMKDGVYLLRIYGPEKAAETRKVIIR